MRTSTAFFATIFMFLLTASDNLMALSLFKSTKKLSPSKKSETKADTDYTPSAPPLQPLTTAKDLAQAWQKTDEKKHSISKRTAHVASIIEKLSITKPEWHNPEFAQEFDALLDIYNTLKTEVKGLDTKYQHNAQKNIDALFIKIKPLLKERIQYATDIPSLGALVKTVQSADFFDEELISYIMPTLSFLAHNKKGASKGENYQELKKIRENLERLTQQDGGRNNHLAALPEKVLAFETEAYAAAQKDLHEAILSKKNIRLSTIVDFVNQYGVDFFYPADKDALARKITTDFKPGTSIKEIQEQEKVLFDLLKKLDISSSSIYDQLALAFALMLGKSSLFAQDLSANERTALSPYEQDLLTKENLFAAQNNPTLLLKNIVEKKLAIDSLLLDAIDFFIKNNNETSTLQQRANFYDQLKKLREIIDNDKKELLQNTTNKLLQGIKDSLQKETSLATIIALHESTTGSPELQTVSAQKAKTLLDQKIKKLSDAFNNNEFTSTLKTIKDSSLLVYFINECVVQKIYENIPSENLISTAQSLRELFNTLEKEGAKQTTALTAVSTLRSIINTTMKNHALSTRQRTLNTLRTLFENLIDRLKTYLVSGRTAITPTHIQDIENSLKAFARSDATTPQSKQLSITDISRAALKELKAFAVEFQRFKIGFADPVIKGTTMVGGAEKYKNEIPIAREYLNQTSDALKALNDLTEKVTTALQTLAPEERGTALQELTALKELAERMHQDALKAYVGLVSL